MCTLEGRTLNSTTKRLSISQALREGLAEEMSRDPNVFCMGEDISIPGGWGGVFTVTLGLEEKYRSQLLDTPISELGYFGLAVGAAIMGMRPVIDVQYGDFLFLAMDQIVNQAAKMRYMSGGKAKVPLVIRAPVGATGRGAQHAQNLERFFVGVPGLKVVCPATAYDAKGLLKSAIRDDNPVMMFEHKLLYGSKGLGQATGDVDASDDIPAEDYTVPIGKGIVRRQGSDVTIVATLLMMHVAMNVAEELEAEGVSVEVIDPRSLSPFDWDLVEASVLKTTRVVVVEEGPKTGGWGAETAATLGSKMSDCLTAPVVRVASPDIPVPFSQAMESCYRPSRQDIKSAVLKLID
jgi:pyruvate/2-oxoglutarate/acetoin dehydrogenase E1 component